MYADIADGCHDDCGNQNTGQNGNHGLFEAQVQKASAQGAGPGPGAGEGNAHKGGQGDDQAVFAEAAGREFLACGLALVMEEVADFADIGLIQSPDQELSGKEIDNGDRDHIANGTYNDGR